MDTELFELCKKVYEKTGWAVEFDKNYPHSPVYFDPDGSLTSPTGAILVTYPERYTPLYTSDYLLEKLPHKIKHKSGMSKGWLELAPMDKESWGACYTYEDESFYFNWSDTPLKALLKLTIALSEAGELK